MASAAPAVGESEHLRLEQLGSPAAAGVRAHERIDPYFSDFWPVGSKASWLNIHQLRRAEAGGWAKRPWWLAEHEERARARLTGPRLPETLQVLGALRSWQNVSAEQLAAITGIDRIGTGRAALMTDLFNLGLVEIGVHTDAAARTSLSARSNIYRLTRDTSVERLVWPVTTYAERLKITGGLDTRASGAGGHDRHGVLATELGLRAAETHTLSAVLGENVGRVQDILGTGWNRTFTADEVWVRTDGMLIALELTATPTTVERKIARWAHLLASRPMQALPLTVLFVTAENPNIDASASRNVRKKTFHAVRTGVRDTPGHPGNRTAERIGVVDWRDWFPAPGQATVWFPALSAWFATGAPAQPWESRSLLDPFEFEVGDTSEDVLAQLSALYANPVWLRPAPGATIDPVTPALAAEFGYPVQMLAAAPARGAVGGGGLPERLRW